MQFPGTTVTIGAEKYVVPALSLGQLRNGILPMLREHDKLIAEDKTFDAMEIRGKVILEALRRNYPDFDETKLFDFLDMANTQQIWLAVLGASGFAPGENLAVTETTSGT